MADGTIRVPTDGSGKRVDTTEITRPDLTIVERQRVVIGDDESSLGRIEGVLIEIREELKELRLALLDALH
jgi:hypothetical protein